MKPLPALPDAFALILFSAALRIAALARLMAAAWLALLAPPAAHGSNWLLAQTLPAFGLSPCLGSRYTSVSLGARAAASGRQAPPQHHLYGQAGYFLSGLAICLSVFTWRRTTRPGARAWADRSPAGFVLRALAPARPQTGAPFTGERPTCRLDRGASKGRETP